MAEGGTNRSMSKTKSGDPGDSSLYSVHSKKYVESVSVEICAIMSRLGYGEEIRRWRIWKYKENDRISNSFPRNSYRITAGSKAEGLTGVYESDQDKLFVMNSVLCVEDGSNLNTIPYDIEVYRMDTRVYPGHCRLFLERTKPNVLLLGSALCCNDNGDVLLSSGLVLEELLIHLRIYQQYHEYSTKHNMMQHERAGPSLPVSMGGKHVDRVFSLRCQCPSILQRWAARLRYWPSSDIVQKVVSLGACLTPVGHKGSENKHMEWRICFNTGETELVNNLNDTHTKVYVLLKMILKDVLMPCKKEITSYVMKNIVLWQAEKNPQDKFHARSLIHWLHDGLRELRTAIMTQQLPYFMIPERNLMAASGLQDEQQSKWVADITDMMAEGPRVILRLPKIRQAVIASPEPFMWFNKSRIELEMLHLEFSVRELQFRKENGVPDYCDVLVDTMDAVQQNIHRRFRDILFEMMQRMFLEGCALNDLDDIHPRCFFL